jgi:hypothetical protein
MPQQIVYVVEVPVDNKHPANTLYFLMDAAKECDETLMEMRLTNSNVDYITTEFRVAEIEYPNLSAKEELEALKKLMRRLGIKKWTMKLESYYGKTLIEV